MNRLRRNAGQWCPLAGTSADLTNFSNANLSKASFLGASLDGADFSGAIMIDTVFVL